MVRRLCLNSEVDLHLWILLSQHNLWQGIAITICSECVIGVDHRSASILWINSYFE
jgi:hypothetical protein